MDPGLAKRIRLASLIPSSQPGALGRGLGYQLCAGLPDFTEDALMSHPLSVKVHSSPSTFQLIESLSSEKSLARV